MKLSLGGREEWGVGFKNVFKLPTPELVYISVTICIKNKQQIYWRDSR